MNIAYFVKHPVGPSLVLMRILSVVYLYDAILGTLEGDMVRIINRNAY